MRLEDNQVMMLWIATDFERSVWAKYFRQMILPDSPYLEQELPKLVTTDANEFIATIYRCLVPQNRTEKTGRGSRMDSEPSTGYKIRIV